MPHAMPHIRAACLALPLLSALSLIPAPAAAQNDWDRMTIWDLELGTAVEDMPPVEEFKDYACGSNGGPPGRRIAGWTEYAQCAPEPSGLHEVYFEYDDEQEYVARAMEMVGELTRWAGTTERNFPVIASALFDDAGILRGLRLVTDPRPDARPDNFWVDIRAREEFHQLSAVLAARFDITPSEHCTSQPPAEGETPVGDVFIKLSCEKTDAENGRRILLQTHFFRKPGQHGRNPFLQSQLTRGQFESSSRLEIYQLD